jgi:6-phosphogluconolactonase
MSNEGFDFDGEFGDLEDDLDLTLYTDAKELTEEVIAQTLQSVSEGLSDRGRFDLALTGGTLGLAISNKLVEALNQNASDYQGLHIWFSDERFVAANSQDRNAQPFHGTMKNSNVIVHEVLASDHVTDAELSLSDYEKALQDVNLDLVILGLGPDGHVASLFPGLADIDDLRKVFLITDSPKPPPVRISFTMAMINSSSKVWLVATGESKADAVTKIIEADLSIPASYVRGSVHTRLIVDTEAFFAE